MRLLTNAPLLKRNAAIGKYASLGGMIILLGGLVVSFYGANNPALQTIPFFTLIIGFMLSNIGIYYQNRYVREPRADKALEAALKGFDDRYCLYNFYLPAPHFLITPHGLFALVAKFQSGVVQWDGKRWKHVKGGSFIQSFFGREPLGNPTTDAAAEAEAAAKFLAKKVGGDIPPVQAIIVFYNPNLTLEGDSPPLPAVHAKQLKEHLRKTTKGAGPTKESAAGGRQITLTPEQVVKLNEVVGV